METWLSQINTWIVFKKNIHEAVRKYIKSLKVIVFKGIKEN